MVKKRVRSRTYGEKEAARDKRYREKNREKIRARNRAWSLQNKEHIRQSALQRRYKMSMVEYETLLSLQGGGCAICGGVSDGIRLAVDHDHKTGKVRALLCVGCNLGIGNFKENLDSLRRAISYLQQHHPRA